MPKRLTYDTDEVQAILDRVVAGGAVAKSKTTAEWNASSGFIPEAGELIIYSDYQTVTEGGETRYIPGIKIGSGNAYVQDLAFMGARDSEILIAHIHDAIMHTTAAEKAFWNNKLNVNDSSEVVEETLILNRN